MDINISYKPHKYQLMLHQAAQKYRYVVVCAGRRSGKSKFARMQLIHSALYDPGVYWMVTPTYKQGKMIHWRELKKEIPSDIITYKNEQELAIEFGERARIEIKGADKEDSLRGVGIKGVVIDEAAFQQPHIWEDIIEPMLLDYEGWAIFVSTPHGFNWFYDLWLRGQANSETYDPEWISHRFTSYDNPTIPNNKRELDKKRERVDEDTFSTEYLAEFKKYKGLIYKNFNRETHVINPFSIPDNGQWEIYRGVDFGYGVNPTACVWIAVAPDDKWYVIDEYYEIKGTTPHFCKMVLSQEANLPPIISSWCDPHNKLLRDEWRANEVYITEARKDSNIGEGQTNKTEWVATGIEIIQNKLKIKPVDGQPSLFIFKHCTNLIREFEAYEWQEEKDETTNAPIRPKKANDHLLDALRYFAISYRGRQEIYVEKDTRDWSFV